MKFKAVMRGCFFHLLYLYLPSHAEELKSSRYVTKHVTEEQYRKY